MMDIDKTKMKRRATERLKKMKKIHAYESLLPIMWKA